VQISTQKSELRIQNFLWWFLGAALAVTNAFAQLSVQEIQFTTDPSGNSPYVNQSVTVQGVVTAVAYNYPPLWGQSFFIADSDGGAWSGLLIATNTGYEGQEGAWVEITGTVKETSNQTNIQSPSITTLGTASLPVPSEVTAEEFNAEGYEGVLVILNDVVVSAEESGGIWMVQDATGEVRVGHTWPYVLYQPALGDTIAQLIGISVYLSGTYRLEPRTDDDIILSGNPRPVIEILGHYPASPTASDQVQVRALVADDDELTRVELHYLAGAVSDSVNMDSADSLYIGWIPAFPQGTVVSYFVLAEDAEGEITQEAGTPYVVAAPRVSVPIDSIVNNFSLFQDQAVTVEGLVIYLMEWTTSTGSTRITAYMQDSSGRGIELSQSGSMSSFPNLERGNYVSLNGIVGEFESSVQISDFSASAISIIYPDLPISTVEPDSFLLTGDPNNEDLLSTDLSGITAAGTWCKAKGYLLSVESAGGGRNLTLNDGSGNLVVRIWDDMDVPGAFIGGDVVAFEDLIGQVIGVSGAASYFNGFQIEVGYAEDVTAEQPSEEASSQAVVWVEPHPFVPDLGETIKIRFNAPAGAWMRLRLLNLKGQMAAMIRDQQSGGGYEIEWDGLDELNRRVPVGAYILQLQSTLNGNTTIASAPLVVGTRLK
jgi:hypothetical protein